MPEAEKVIMVFGLQVLLLNLQVEVDVAAALYMDVVDAAAGHAMDAAAAGHEPGAGGNAAGGNAAGEGGKWKGGRDDYDNEHAQKKRKLKVGLVAGDAAEDRAPAKRIAVSQMRGKDGQKGVPAASQSAASQSGASRHPLKKVQREVRRVLRPLPPQERMKPCYVPTKNAKPEKFEGPNLKIIAAAQAPSPPYMKVCSSAYDGIRKQVRHITKTAKTRSLVHELGVHVGSAKLWHVVAAGKHSFWRVTTADHDDKVLRFGGGRTLLWPRALRVRHGSGLRGEAC
ncbi:hypothetical protein RI054_01g03910 [Pseudoscourfieldia marina]